MSGGYAGWPGREENVEINEMNNKYCPLHGLSLGNCRYEGGPLKINLPSEKKTVLGDIMQFIIPLWPYSCHYWPDRSCLADQ